MRSIQLTVAALVGLVAGLGVYTFVYAKGSSYLTDSPAACANCHIMSDHYRAWTRASHRAVAGCNDCHTPAALVPKYLTKANNGFWHSFYFTTGRHPDPIRINRRNLEIAERACQRCHAEITASIAPAHARPDAGLACTPCHADVGHLE